MNQAQQLSSDWPAEVRIAFVIVNLIVVLIVGGFYLLIPRFSRRGLLFGVYVGEDAAAGEPARAIRATWTRSIVTLIVMFTVLAALLPLVLHGYWSLLAGPGMPLVFVLATFVVYLRAYFAARRMAVPGAPAAVAPLTIEPTPAADLVLPWTALLVALCCGVFAVAYAGLHYAELPSQIPTHFGFAGKPDAWRPKSVGSVFLPALLGLVTSLGIGVIALMTSRAKRAVRSEGVVSLLAQRTFRLAMSRLLSIMTLFITGMMTTLTMSSIRVGLGRSDRLSPLMMVFTIGVLGCAFGGLVWILFRYGQGGSRLEKSAESAPLTNGLADNRSWVLGMFYVNRNDPSFLVEHRFGLGYTLNFGNPKAVAFLVVFIGLVLGLSLLAVFTS